jgi:hypothetical protein
MLERQLGVFQEELTSKKGTTKMSVIEQRFMEMMPHVVEEVAKQLKIMNKLKALELKAKPFENNITPEMVDDIMED